jgi:HlyD family secretion protein
MDATIPAFRDTTEQDRLLAAPPFWKRHRMALLLAAASIAVIAFAAPPILRATGVRGSVSTSRLSIATVERGLFVRDFAADGRVVAANSPMLYAPAAGTVALRVKPGDVVSRDQLLAVIDSPDIEARLSVERASLDALRSELHRARLEADRRIAELRQLHEQAEVEFRTNEREYERSRKAFEFGAYSRMQMERAEDAMEKARFALQYAQRNLESAPEQSRLDLESREAMLRRQQVLVDDLERQVAGLQVRSPFDGQVGQIQVSDRASVPRDAPLLTVVDLSQLEVEIDVPETFARDLSPGMGAELSGNGRTWTGSISGVSPEVVNGQVVARVRLGDDRPDGLRQNQRLSVRVMIERRDDVLMVERGMLSDQAAGQVWRVEDGFAVRTPVRFGSTSIGRIEILEGLSPGDRIVVSGMDAFNDAERVILSN